MEQKNMQQSVRGRIIVHDRNIRGKTNMGWLNSHHTFSFGGFQDPKRMGFRSLRVINDDIVAPGAGFGQHPHANMEILSYVIDGALEHKDSMGNGSVINAGDLQYMSAGSGVTHSEFNHSGDHPVHFYQIWILPNEVDAEPIYKQKAMSEDLIGKDFTLIVSPDGEKETISIRQDAKLYLARPKANAEITYDFAAGRAGFLQVMRGQIELNGDVLKQGDGAQIEDVDTISVRALADSEVMLFDLV